MKLHLPYSLLKALIKCALSITLVTGAAHAGVYTWTGATDQWVHTVTNWTPNLGNYATIWATGTPNNILKFSGDYLSSANKAATIQFNTMSLGGILVDSGATGFTLMPNGNNNRALFFRASSAADAATIGGVTGQSNIIAKEDLNIGSASLRYYYSGAAASAIFYSDANLNISAGKTVRFYASNRLSGDTTTRTINIQGGGTFAIDSTSTVNTNNIAWNIYGGSTLDLAPSTAGRTQTVLGTGNITMNGGTLNLATGSITLSNNLIIGADGGDILGATSVNLTSSNLTFASDDLSNSTLAFGPSVTSVTLAANQTINFASGANNGIYTLISTSGTLIGDASTYTVTGLGGRQIYNLANTGSSLTINIEGSIANLTWNGTEGNSTWNLDTANKNWNNGGTADSFYAGDAVTFDGTAESQAVTVSGILYAGNIDVTGGNYTFTSDGTGSISGGGALTVSNATATLNMSNSYTGGTTVNAGGTLNATAANSLGTGRLTVNGGTANIGNTQTLAGTTITGGEVVVKSTNAQAGLGTITGSAGNGALVIDWTTGNDSGSAGTAAAASNVAAYAGDLIVRSGRVTGNTPFAASSITVTQGGQLYIGGGTWAQNFTISGSGWSSSDVAATGALRVDTATITGSLTVQGDSTIRVHAGTGTINGAVIGTGILTKVGTGTLVLGNASSGFTGTLDITEGQLTLNSSGSGNAALNNGNIIMEANTKLAFQGNSGAFTTKSDGTVTLKSGVQVWGINPTNGTHTISTDFILDTGSGYANIGGFTQGNSTVIFSTISGTGNLSIKDEGTGSGGSNGFAFRDGWLTNSYEGQTLIRRSITFDTNAVTNGQTITPFGLYQADGSSGIATVQNGATLTISGNSGTGTANTVTLANGFVLDGGNLVLNNLGNGIVSGSITAASASIIASNSECLTLEGGLKGSGNITYSNSTANSRLVLSGTNNNYTGTLSLGTASRLEIAGNATGLSGMTIAAAAGKTVSVGNDNGNLSLGSAITGAGNLVKSGTGSVLLSGANTYSGGTTVQGGTIIAGSASAFGTGTVRLSDGVMDFNGYNLANGIVVSNGTSANKLLSAGNNATAGAIVLEAGSVLALDVSNSGTSGINWTLDSLTYDQTSSLIFDFGTVGVSTGKTYDLLSWTGASENDYRALIDSGILNWKAGNKTSDWTESYAMGSDGSNAWLQVTFNQRVVPEPATAAMGILGMASLLLRRRRRA